MAAIIEMPSRRLSGDYGQLARRCFESGRGRTDGVPVCLDQNRRLCGELHASRLPVLHVRLINERDVEEAEISDQVFVRDRVVVVEKDATLTDNWSM